MKLVINEKKVAKSSEQVKKVILSMIKKGIIEKGGKIMKHLILYFWRKWKQRQLPAYDAQLAFELSTMDLCNVPSRKKGK